MNPQLNLSTSPQPNNRPFIAFSALFGTLGVIALGILSVASYQSWRANRDLHADMSRWSGLIEADQQRQRALAAEFRTAGDQQVLGRSAFLNSLIDERSFPWTKLFTDLERTLPPGVRVVTISPKLVNGRAEVTLEIGSLTDDGKIQFLEAMEKSKVFSGLAVVSERHPTEAGSADKTITNLTVWYSTT